MTTLIELYDERPFENVLATEMFKPRRTVFLCDKSVAENRPLQGKLREYFRHRGLDTEVIFRECSLFHAEKIKAAIQALKAEYGAVAIDITGGTDAALFAAGMAGAEGDIPVFTYSRKRNTFYNIINAPFADKLPCALTYRVEDYFLMAGGAMREGRVDNAVLSRYRDLIDPFFAVFLHYRREWTDLITYFQRVSQTEKGQPVPLGITAPRQVKGEHGKTVSGNVRALRELQSIGMIRDLTEEKDGYRFTFKDEQVRAWLRDVGSVLELFVYKRCADACIPAGAGEKSRESASGKGAESEKIFSDVRTSVVVDWDADKIKTGVSNEIDVMAVRGVQPLFISCKVCEIATEALNELAILKDRFGGKGARAMIVSAEKCRALTRSRAQELGIEVVDLEDLENGWTMQGERGI